jgi:hypothetical protein
MSQALGSIFDEQTGQGGIDLEYRTTFHPAVRQAGGRYAVPIPDRLDVDGLMVDRVQRGGEKPGHVQVTLPADSPDRFKLRLRGFGAKDPDSGAVGDLYLILSEDPAAPQWARRDQLAPVTSSSPMSSGRVAITVSGIVLAALLVLKALGFV